MTISRHTADFDGVGKGSGGYRAHVFLRLRVERAVLFCVRWEKVMLAYL
jgi:hypothetical protein